MRNVFIITRCTDINLRKSATLIFDTIRIGFPTFNITCFYLGDFLDVENEIRDKCAKNNIKFCYLGYKFNNEVIEYLVETENEDFIIVDSDIVFWKNLEWYSPSKNIAGRYIPTYWESFNKTITQERLHTSLMYFSGLSKLRNKVKESFEQKCGGKFTPYNVFNPVVVKQNGDSIFYDSCCILYQAIGGEAFDKNVIDCYEHLFCGSFYTEVAKDKPQLAEFFDSVFANINSARNVSRKQRNYWYSNVHSDVDRIFKSTLSEEAQHFIGLYCDYIEHIDDLVDTDNKTLVDKVTEKALKLFSCTFWLKNSTYLRLIEQMVHIMYFNSVEWEKSSVAWKRRDSRALSHCGYFFPLAIFLFETGDVQLTRELSLKLLERSHLAHAEDMIKEDHVS